MEGNISKIYDSITEGNMQDLIEYIKSYDKFKSCDENNKSSIIHLLHAIRDYILDYISPPLSTIAAITVPPSDDIIIIDHDFHRGIEEIVNDIFEKFLVGENTIIINRCIMIYFRSDNGNIITVSIKYEFIDYEFKLCFYIIPVENNSYPVKIEIE